MTIYQIAFLPDYSRNFYSSFHLSCGFYDLSHKTSIYQCLASHSIKQRFLLIISADFFCFLLNCTKEPFPGNEKQKGPLNSLFPRYHFSIFLYIITETHIQTRKLRAVSVFVSYLPFFNSIFRQANTSFSQNQQYPTPFYLSVLYYHGNP